MENSSKSGTGQSSGSGRSHSLHPFPGQSMQSQGSGASGIDLHDRNDSQSPRKASPADIPTACHSPHQQQFAFHPQGTFVMQPTLHVDAFMRQQEQLQQLAHMNMNQMIQIGNAHAPMIPMIPEFSYFAPNMLMTHRPEDFRPTNSYPLNAVFVNDERKTCCLVDRGSRCERPAGTAGFTLRIRELVVRAGALLQEDGTAGHHYICDYHKNYIQKLRVVAQPAANLVSPFVPTGNHQPVFQTFPLDAFSNQQHPQTSQQQPPAAPLKQEPPVVEHERERPSRTSSASPQKSSSGAESAKTTKETTKDHHEPVHVPAPIDMRRPIPVPEIRPITTISTTPDTEPTDSSEEEYDGGPAPSDLLYGLADSFSLEELTSYLKHFDIEFAPRTSKDDLAKMVAEHMDSVPVTDIKTSLLNFFHAVKTDTRPFCQPYKAPLNVDFDLSSDEEMMLMDTPHRPGHPHNNDSSEDEGASNGEAEDAGQNGIVFPEIRFDAETEDAFARMNGKVSVEEIERILEKYSLPAKFANGAESDSDSDASETNEDKRGARRRKKIRAAN